MENVDNKSITTSGTPADERYGKDVKSECGTCKGSKQISISGCCNMVHKYIPCPDCQQAKPKPLAQYLAEYLTQDKFTYKKYDEEHIGIRPATIKCIIKQALDAYESTENVKIKIEKC